MSTHLTKTINSLHVSMVYDDNYGIVRPLKTSNQIFGNSFETSLISNTIVDRLPYHRIISEDHEDYKVNEVMSEIKDMGVEFVEALRCIADVLKAADHGNYIGNSLAIDIAQHPERHLKTMYELSRVNERMGFSMFQCFPLKRSFIPSFIPLDLGIVGSHISGISIKFSSKPTKNIRDGCKRMESHCVYCGRRME